MMKNILTLLVLLCFFAGCGNKAEEKQDISVVKVDSDAIRIAVQPTFECLPLMVAEENNLFDSCGVKVALVMFNSQADCDTAMTGNSADAMITDIVRGKFWEHENKESLNYVTWTNSHFMLVTSKKARVKDLTQMTDKLMSVTRHSITDVLADSAIERAGKTPEEMFKVQINNQETRLNMLLENKMDAAFLQYPYAAEALSKGGSLLMHGGMSGAGVLAFKEDADRNEIKLILDAYNEACDIINKKGVMYFSPVVEKYMHKDIRKWQKYFKDVKFGHTKDVDAEAQNIAKKLLKDIK